MEPPSRSTGGPQPGPLGLSKFFESIPDLTPKLEKLHTAAIDYRLPGRREEIRLALLKSVEQSLRAGVEPWVSEIAEFNYDRGKAGDAQYITSLLLDHAIERPWILESGFMGRVGWNIVNQGASGGHNLHPVGLCANHEACQTLDSLVEHHGSIQVVDTGAPGTWIATLPEPREVKDSLRDDLAFAIDSQLGFAGVIPLEAAREFFRSRADTSDRTNFDEVQHRERFLREFEEHVWLCPVDSTTPDQSCYKARVSFIPKSATTSNATHTAELLERISRMIAHLEHSLAWCQVNGKCLLGIPFLVRTRTSTLGIPDDEVVALRILPLDVIQSFFQSFRDLKAASSMAGGWSLSSPKTVAAAAAVALVAFDVGPDTLHAGIFVALIVIAGLLRHSAQSKETTASAALLDALTVIFRTIGLDSINPEEEPRPIALLGLLHYASLAVQSISLALQASVRGFTSPLDFVFLEDDVTEITLIGAGDIGPRVYASTQPLTCLGNMIGQDVVVFRDFPPEPATRLDLVASVRNVLSVWGPGEVEIIQRPTEPGSGPDNEAYTISRIRIGDGSLRPADTYQDPHLPAWHWELSDDKDVRLEKFAPEASPVNLDTKIRIGVRDSAPLMPAATDTNTGPPLTLQLGQNAPKRPGPFTPIGPSHENSQCPRANEYYDFQRRSAMSPYLREIGTHEAYHELAGHDFGAQAGQYFLLQGMRRWDRRPARTVKDTLLDESQSPVELIKKLDKPCALFASCCTPVMARARLRDLIAFAAPLLHPDLIPGLKGLSPSGSTTALVRALQSPDTNFLAWASLHQTASSTTGNTNTPLAHSPQLKHLILSTLKSLKTTGITPTSEFELAWLSSHHPSMALRTPCAPHPWLLLLRDDPYSATFACTTPLCLGTRLHRCALTAASSSSSSSAAGGRGGGSQSLPHSACSLRNGAGGFTLSTRILPYRGLPAGHLSSNMTTTEPLTVEALKVGCSYWLNAASTGVVARVVDSPFSGNWGQGYCRVMIKESKIPGVIRKRLVMRGEWMLVREVGEGEGVECLVGGC